MKLIVRVVFGYDDDVKKFETEIFFHDTNEQTIILETDSDAFADIINSFMKEYN